MGRDVLDHRRPARRSRGSGLRRCPAADRGPGGSARRRDASGRVRVPWPGDRRCGRPGQGAAHGADRARAGRGDGGPGQSGRVAGRLHQSGGDRDAGAARRGPSRRGAVQRRHLGPEADRPLSRRRPRRRGGRARRAQPPDVDPLCPHAASRSGRRRDVRGGPPRRALRSFRPRGRARERGADRRAPPAARAAIVLRPLLLRARCRGGAAVGGGIPVACRRGRGARDRSYSRSTGIPPWRRSRLHFRSGAVPITHWRRCA